MKVPEKFPPGCSFVPTFGGEEFVMFPDGAWFRFSDDESELLPTGLAPGRSGAPSGGITFRDTPPSSSKAKAAS